jgi:hypothetical protein
MRPLPFLSTGTPLLDRLLDSWRNLLNPEFRIRRLEVVSPPTKSLVDAKNSGAEGQVAYDTSYLYICINKADASGAMQPTWFRASIATW